MPELPEVETITRGLAHVLTGARIARVEQRRPDLRFPFPERFAERLAGRRIARLARRAKYILVHLDGGEVLAVHLGMTGRFTIRAKGRNAGCILGSFEYEAGADPVHDHLRIELGDGTEVTFNDARRFGYMSLIEEAALETHPHFKELGVEPLGPLLDADYLAAMAGGRRTDLKAFLMDQRIVAGLGNIYVCEALWRAGLSPKRAAASLARRGGKPSDGAVRLVPHIRAVLEDAIGAGGSTLRDYRDASGASGLFQTRFAVYGREGEACPRAGCGGTVRRIVQAGRSTFHCPRCQT